MSLELSKIIERQQREWQIKQKQDYIPRIQLPTAEQALSSTLIKVITGPRRAGKSVLAAILLKNHRAAYFNFDEPAIAAGVFDAENLLPALERAYGENPDFLFFDEIQNLPGWQLFLNRLHREGRNVLISGSNANLLSGELATHLTGRHIKIEVLPFCFSEFLLTRDEDPTPANTALAAESFLRLGGYPEVVLGGGIHPADYLRTLFDAIIGRDIVSRYRVRKRHELISIADWSMSNISKELSFTGLATEERDSGLPESHLTVKKYIGHLEEAYLLRLMTRYDRQHKQRLKSPKKIYAIDNGMALATGFRQTPDNGRLLENMVYSELRKNLPSADLHYFRSTQGDREVDFVVRDDNQNMELIQVCWDMTNAKTKKRELAGLSAAAKETRCRRATIVTWNEREELIIDGLKVRAIPFHEWAVEE